MEQQLRDAGANAEAHRQQLQATEQQLRDMRADTETYRQQLQVAEQQLRDASANAEAQREQLEQQLRDSNAKAESHHQQLEQQLQAANDKIQKLSARLQQTLNSLTAVRKALDVAPRSEAVAPVGSSISVAIPATHGVKRERVGADQTDASHPRHASKRIKKESSGEDGNTMVVRRCEEIVELSD